MSPRRLAAAVWWAIGARLFAAEAEPEPQAEVQVCVVPVALAMYVSTPDSSPARAYVKSLVPSAVFEDEDEDEEDEPCA